MLENVCFLLKIWRIGQKIVTQTATRLKLNPPDLVADSVYEWYQDLAIMIKLLL
jgi:hypothetical protein